jgi:NADH:ubiquinone oxidoreductase subunit 6 (subunit J)
MTTVLAITETSVATALLFYAFAGVVVASAVTVVISRNIVRTAVGLLFALVGVAGLYFLLNAEFLAAVQLVVYVGGTLILVIFGVMLTSKSPFSRFEPKRGEVMLAVCIGAVLLASMSAAIVNWTLAHPSVAPREAGHDRYAIATLGLALLGDYLVPFELASVILLVVMIGAAYLAKGRREH